MGAMEIYHDLQGGHAAIRVMKNGSARLTLRGACGRPIWAKNYRTVKEAKIAMRRLGTNWRKVL